MECSSSSDGCSEYTNSEYEEYTVTIQASLSISYSASSHYSTASDPTPTLSGNYSPSTYTSTTGLSINPITSIIHLSASTTGTYTVTWTQHSDNSTATTPVTIASNSLC